MITGHLPYGDDSVEETIHAVLTGSLTPIRRYCPDVPEELVRVVHSCLSRRRRERPRDMMEVLDVLNGAPLGGLEDSIALPPASGGPCPPSTAASVGPAVVSAEASKDQPGAGWSLALAAALTLGGGVILVNSPETLDQGRRWVDRAKSAAGLELIDTSQVAPALRYEIPIVAMDRMRGPEALQAERDQLHPQPRQKALRSTGARMGSELESAHSKTAASRDPGSLKSSALPALRATP